MGNTKKKRQLLIGPCVVAVVAVVAVVVVGGWFFARVQYSSLGEGATSVSLGAVHMEEGVRVRVQADCGGEEVNDGEKHGERQNEKATKNRRSNAHHG